MRNTKNDYVITNLRTHRYNNQGGGTPIHSVLRAATVVKRVKRKKVKRCFDA